MSGIAGNARKENQENWLAASELPGIRGSEAVYALIPWGFAIGDAEIAALLWREDRLLERRDGEAAVLDGYPVVDVKNLLKNCQ